MKDEKKRDAGSENPAEDVLPKVVMGDRRKRNVPVALDRRNQERTEVDRQVERRRQIDPTTCERDYSDEEVEFMKAMDEYKREFGRPFPTWSEVLEVLKAMGYRKVAERTAIPLTRSKIAPPDDEF